MTINENDIMRVTAKQSQHGKDVQNVYHAKLVGTGDLTDLEVRQAINTKISVAHAELIAEQSVDLLYASIETWNVTQDRPVGESPWVGISAGTGLSGELPPAVAGMVLFNTLVARSQGRKYIGGLVENANEDDGTPDSDAILALLAYAGVMLSFSELGTGEMQFGNYRALPLRFATWDSAEASMDWKTQRRRYIGAGS